MGKVILPNRSIPFKARRWCHGMDSGRLFFDQNLKELWLWSFPVSALSWRGREERGVTGF